MKLAEYEFNKNTRKDTAVVDFINDINKIINLGRYQMRVVSTVPTYTGEEGEHLLYVSGSVRRLYWYDITNSTWHYIHWQAAGLGQATILATVQLTGQTGDIGATTIYLPAAAGLFRISVYMICTTAGAGTLSCTLGWSDAVGAKTLSPASAVDLSSTANGSTGTAFISATAVAITYATAIAAKVGSPQYAIYICLEAIA